MNKFMSLHPSKLNDQSFNHFCSKYSIGPEYKPTLPSPNHRITDCPDGYIALYTAHFHFSNLRIPFSIFFLNFLKEYRLNISQLSPLSVIKVTHFEIACRALGGEPTLPLFRQFFILGRYGDLYTVEKRKCGVLSCVSSAPRLLENWKECFFWVSTDVLPFKMQWREHHEALNVIDPCYEQFDEKLYQLLVNHQMPLQPFPEHVLIMTGLSRNWPYRDTEPILKDGDNKEIELVEYMKKKDVGHVKPDFRFLEKHEVNILDRTRGICYERPQTGVGKVEIPVEYEYTTGDYLEPERLLVTSVVKLEEPLVVPELDKVKQIVLETVSEGQKRQQPDEPASLLKKQKVVIGEHVVASSDKSRSLEKNDAAVQPGISSEKVVISEAGRSFDELPRKKSTVAKNKVEHAKIVEALKKELEAAREMQACYLVESCDLKEKLKQVNSELEKEREKTENLKQVNEKLELAKAIAAREKADWTKERVRLEKSLEQVSFERQWLIEEGFEYVINRLHKSKDFLKPLGDVQSKLWSSAAHDGVVAGYAHCEAGVKLEDVELYDPEAEKEFTKAVYELEHLKFPYVGALSQCADRTLDELKALEPMGMEDEEAKVAD